MTTLMAGSPMHNIKMRDLTAITVNINVNTDDDFKPGPLTEDDFTHTMAPWYECTKHFRSQKHAAAWLSMLAFDWYPNPWSGGELTEICKRMVEFIVDDVHIGERNCIWTLPGNYSGSKFMVSVNERVPDVLTPEQIFKIIRNKYLMIVNLYGVHSYNNHCQAVFTINAPYDLDSEYDVFGDTTSIDPCPYELDSIDLFDVTYEIRHRIDWGEHEPAHTFDGAVTKLQAIDYSHGNDVVIIPEVKSMLDGDAKPVYHPLCKIPIVGVKNKKLYSADIKVNRNQIYF